jgi:hypothetical protein
LAFTSRYFANNVMRNRAIISLTRPRNLPEKQPDVEEQKILGSESMRRRITPCAAVLWPSAIMAAAATARRGESS